MNGILNCKKRSAPYYAKNKSSLTPLIHPLIHIDYQSRKLTRIDMRHLNKSWSVPGFTGFTHSALVSVVLVICLFFHAATVHAYTANQCAASRFGSNLACTANDVSVTSITPVAGSYLPYCVGGSSLTLDLNVTVQFQSPTRYDIGVFLSNDGKSPQYLTSHSPPGASSCSVGILPTTPPFWGSVASGGDGDSCGDGGNSLSGSFTMYGVTLPCTTDGSGNTILYAPYVVTWNQSSNSTDCSSNTDPVPGTTSKCNASQVNFTGISIVVMPSVTITDGSTTILPTGSTTYTIVVTNNTASTSSGVILKDPLPANFSYSSVSCSAAGGAACPSVNTTNIQTGVSLGTMPINSTLTFTVTGSLNASCGSSLTNTASITASGQTISASDSDLIMCSPTVTKSFSPSVIAPYISGCSSCTSTLTFTIANPNSASMTGVGFTDSYPSGMANYTTPASSNTCGGTLTATAGAASLNLSGGSIPANSNCTVTVKVTSTSTGVNTATVNSTNALSSSGTGTLYVAKTMALSPNTQTVANDGTTAAVITATITDPAGNAVVGDSVTLSCNLHATPSSQIIATSSSGVASFSITDTTSETVTCTATDSTGLTGQVTATFSAASAVSNFNAFESSTSPTGASGATSGRIYTKLAGTAFNLDAVALSGAALATAFNGAITVDLVANNTPGSSYDSSSHCPTSYAAITSSTATASGSWSNGRRTFSFPAIASAYRDVRVRISYPTSSPSITTCSTDSFAIRPAAFTVTSVDATNTGTSGAPAIKAGADFNLTATALAGYGGTPNLDATKVVGTSTAGALSGSFGAANSATGVSVGNAFTYSEVGNFGLNVDAVHDDNFTSIDQSSDCTDDFSNVLVGGKYGCKIGSNAVPQSTGVSGFGRFIPDHFATSVVLSAAGVPMPCLAGINPATSLAWTCPVSNDSQDGFVYSGQAFSVRVTALNLGGGTTQNYDGTLGYAKDVTLEAWSMLGKNVSDGATQNPSGSLSNNAIAAANFSAGVASTSTPVYTLTAATTAPTDIYLRALDTDNVTSRRASAPGTSVEGGVKVVSGRVKLANAHGSELLPLPMAATVQYYSGTYWTTSNSDTVTAISASDFALVFPVAVANKLSACETALSVTGSSPNFKVNLSAPGTGNNGWTDLTLNLGAVPTGNRCTAVGGAGAASTTANRAWLQYPTGANPTGRATFGVYKGNNEFIYLRENY